MKKSNVIIFILVILVIFAIFGYAIWDANNSLNEMGENTENYDGNILNDESQGTNTIIQNEIITNDVSTNTIIGQAQNNFNYYGTWYINEESYLQSERIDEIMDQRDENRITEEEFQNLMSSEDNSNIAELEIDVPEPTPRTNTIEIDFTLTSPAPTQREASIKDIIVQLDNNTGTFTYTDNWGTSGNGTITFANNTITLRLETTQAAQGALWGVEGIYTFSYRRMD